jgi:hypothetical protein
MSDPILDRLAEINALLDADPSPQPAQPVIQFVGDKWIDNADITAVLNHIRTQANPTNTAGVNGMFDAAITNGTRKSFDDILNALWDCDWQWGNYLEKQASYATELADTLRGLSRYTIANPVRDDITSIDDSDIGNVLVVATNLVGGDRYGHAGQIPDHHSTKLNTFQFVERLYRMSDQQIPESMSSTDLNGAVTRLLGSTWTQDATDRPNLKTRCDEARAFLHPSISDAQKLFVDLGQCDVKDVLDYLVYQTRNPGRLAAVESNLPDVLDLPFPLGDYVNSINIPRGENSISLIRKWITGHRGDEKKPGYYALSMAYRNAGEGGQSKRYLKIASEL